MEEELIGGGAIPTEAEFNEAFGLSNEPTEGNNDGGAEDQTGAEGNQGPQERTEGQSGQEQPGGTEEAEDGSGEGAEGRAMSLEERHRQAAARRAREEQARQEAQRASEQASRDSIFREMFNGQTNPYTGKPILTEADYRGYQAETQRREREAQLDAAGISPDTIQTIVDQQMAPMKQELESYRLQNAMARARAVNQAAEAKKKAAIQNISAEMPEIRSIEDIVALPTGDAFNSYVQKGLSIEEAFYLANRQELSTRRVSAARAAAVNASASRQHLNPTGSSGGKPITEVPRGVVETYREFMPDASMDEIRAAYERDMK